MGVKNLSALLKDKNLTTRTSYKNLDGQRVGFDAFNQLYQFLSTIRDPEGNSMRDSDGNNTSHLVGIIYRASAMLQNNLKPVYIFDGKSHQLKSGEQKRRSDAKKLARKAYDAAIEAGDMEKAQMFAKRINDLTPQMVEDAKTLLGAMGIPIIQAPGEGEAQASVMTKNGLLDATASQDYDSLMFGSPILIRNLSSPRTRRSGTGTTIKIEPEVYNLQTVLDSLEITYEQLIDMGILMGTDFNKGFEKVGPKTAYKFIKKYGSFEATRSAEQKIQETEIDYEVVRDIFLKPDAIESIKINFDQPFDIGRISEFLESRNFDIKRYETTLQKTMDIIDFRNRQSTLDDWF